MGKPSTSSQFVQPRTAHQTRSGPISALDKGTGQEPWKLNVVGPTMVGGPSLGDGVLFLPACNVQGYNGVGGSWLRLNYQRTRASTVNDNDYQRQTLHPLTVLFSPRNLRYR